MAKPATDLLDQIWFNAPHIRLAENQTKADGKSYTYFFAPKFAD